MVLATSHGICLSCVECGSAITEYLCVWEKEKEERDEKQLSNKWGIQDGVIFSGGVGKSLKSKIMRYFKLRRTTCSHKSKLPGQWDSKQLLARYSHKEQAIHDL